MRLGLQINAFMWGRGPGHIGADLAAIARAADAAGFDLISVADHLCQVPVVAPLDSEILEAYSTLAYVAAHTSRVGLLTVVSAVTLRHPGVLAKTVTTLDVLSGGRAWLGIGAAWNEEEHRAYGIPFPPLGERFERLEETLQICTRMWAGDERAYRGRHYRLERPISSPQSITRPRPPIMIGGSGERKTLRLVARYADACNVHPPVDIPHKLDVLRRHCDAEGRDYDRIRKSCMIPLDVGGSDGVSRLVERLRSLAGAGIDTVIGAVPGVERIEPLEIIGREVVPAVADL